MRMTQRARRSAVAVVAALAIGGGGVAACTATAAPATTAASASASSAPAIRLPADTGDGARASYADVVRQVMPSVVLISTTEGLGSGVVLDKAGNIVTNAHVAGDATTFQIQVAGTPRRAVRTWSAATPRTTWRSSGLTTRRDSGPPSSATRPRHRRATWSLPSAIRSACRAA